MGLTVTIKSIKPQRLKVDKFRLALLNALRAEGTEQRRVLAQTTATWTGDKPKFESLISLAGGDAMVVTGPTGSGKGVQKWQWLDEGTKPHYIKARRKPTLRYRKGGFRSKTTVGKFTSGAGSPATGPWRSPKIVKHPGNAARYWSRDLSKQRKAPFRDRCLVAMNDAAKDAF